MTKAEFENFTVFFRPIVTWKLFELVDQVDAEVGGFGYVNIKEMDNGRGIVIVEDLAPLPHQEVSSGSVDAGSKDTSAKIADMTSLFDMPCSCVLKEGEHTVAAHAEDMLFSFHSHENHGAFFSATDLEQIETFRQLTKMPFLVSYILNKEGKYSARLDTFRPFRIGNEISIRTVVPTSIEDWVAQEVAEKVEVKKVTKAVTVHHGTGIGPTTRGGPPTPGGMKSSDERTEDSRSISRSAKKRAGGQTPPTPGSKNQQKKAKRREERERKKREKREARKAEGVVSSKEGL